MNVNTKQQKLFKVKQKEKGQEKKFRPSFTMKQISWFNTQRWNPNRKWQRAEKIFEEKMAIYNVFQI